MANLSKERRDRMIAKLEELKLQHSDDASIAALNEIENALREKKYGLVWEQHSEAVDDMLKENIPVLIADPERRLCKDENLPWNFIIEGDNLQALYLLEKTHRGRVDCIYIDPPYNTGARDWKYNNDYVDGNDEYRHSKWLSMMRSRLLVAKRLLNPKDSVLIVTIDEKEYLHLGCLLEEMFPEARIQMVSSVINPKGNRRDNEFSRCEEYLFFVYLGEASITSNGTDMLRESDADEATEDKSIRLRALLRGASNHGRRSDRPNLFYPLLFDTETGKFVGHGPVLKIDENRNDYIPPDGVTAMWPIGGNGDELTWNLQPETLMEKHRQHFLSFSKWDGKKRVGYYLSSGQEDNFKKGLYNVVGYDEDGAYIIELKSVKEKDVRPMTIWHKKSHSASEYGTTFLNKIIGSNRFTFPKSLYAVQDTIRFFVAKKPNAIIVDFFAGSGTTLHAVNLLNAEDEGRRQCIMVTNNEVGETDQKEFESRGIKKGDLEWEERGIAKYVTWPRTVCSINGVDVNGNALKGEYLIADKAGAPLQMAAGFKSNVKYFKCDWTPRKPEDYLLSNALCLHVKELIELQTAREVDGVKQVLILSKSDYKRVFENPEAAVAVENVWVNENLVFSSAEMRVLREKNFRYIPREYFSQELKEVGEYV